MGLADRHRERRSWSTRCVEGAAVVGVTVDDIEPDRAFVICRAATRPTTSSQTSCGRWCKERLRRYEYPHVVEFVDDLPRTATGKIQRFRLRELAGT